jgi:hypothetical protein
MSLNRFDCSALLSNALRSPGSFLGPRNKHAGAETRQRFILGALSVGLPVKCQKLSTYVRRHRLFRA